MPNNITNFLKASFELTPYLKPCKEGDFDFNTIIPTPSHIFQGPLGKAEEEKYGIESCWYDWNIKNWGTKWNAYESLTHSPKLVQFDTAWTPPLPVYAALAALHPTQSFLVLWKDEGRGEANELYYNHGRLIEEREDVDLLEPSFSQLALTYLERRILCHNTW